MTDRHHLIFVSYRGSDQNWATEFVYARLTEAFGSDAVFKAGNAIGPGEAFPAALRRAAASCPVMLVCIGPDWLDAVSADGLRRLDAPDDWVRQEIAIALAAGNHVVPLLIGNFAEVSVPAPDRLPEDIRELTQRQAWRLAPGGGLDLAVPKLVARLAELVPDLARRQDEINQRASQHAPDRPDNGSGRNVQTNTVSGNGTLFAVQNGDQHISIPGRPGSGGPQE